jgi:deoxyribonuclease V
VKYYSLHTWNLDTAAAKTLQGQLCKLVRIESPHQDFSLIAGADLAYLRDTTLVVAAVIVFSLPKLEIVDQTTVCQVCDFPYIPGLLSYREGPALLAAFKNIEIE